MFVISEVEGEFSVGNNCVCDRKRERKIKKEREDLNTVT